MASEPSTVSISVLRHCPGDAAKPQLQTYTLQPADGMTLFMALSEIRETQDPTLAFDFVCRAGICGSCGMLINGRPGLACRSLVKDLGDHIALAPLPGFRLIADLSVDTGTWMRGMSERLQTWLHRSQPTALDAVEERMDPELAEQLHELDRCIECGCCIAACGTAQMRDDFVGAVGINKLARFRLDPRDERDDADYFALIGDDSGVFGCMSLLGCDAHCPKDLPLRTQLAHMRRVMARQALKPNSA